MENNIETNQDNGRGIFYAIIGVATLVITLIGATFAYLAASTNSAPNAVTAAGATITLGYSDVKIGLKENLIPIDTDLTQFAKATFTGRGWELETNGDYKLTGGQPVAKENAVYSFSGITKNDCRDVNGNNICSVYQFTISNPGTNTVSQYVYGSFEVGLNSFENLYFAVFKGTDAEIKAKNGYAVGSIEHDDNTNDAVDTWTTNYTAATKDEADAIRKHVIANKGDLVVEKTKVTAKNTSFDFNNQLDQYLDVGESMTYTIILWVDETGSAQNDQGKQFAGTVRFTTEGNSTGVTGDLTANSGV